MFGRVKLLLGVGLRGASSSSLTTPLHDLHLESGAKMADFAGFLLPMSHPGLSVPESVLKTRSHASLFDVSHMLQTEIRGKDAVQFMESLTPTDIQGLKVGRSSLSLFLDPATGGILDDLVITRLADALRLVTNASRREHDKTLLLNKQREFKESGKEVEVRFLEGEALIAVQGPAAAKCLAEALGGEDLSELPFMCSLSKGKVQVTRCGYTGEDGFEVSLPPDLALPFAKRLLSSDPKLVLAGLAARDVLRLEAGLCLYGADIDEATTPVMARLMWTIGKRRRERRDFPGAEAILKAVSRDKDDPEAMVRVGLSSEAGGGRVARGGAQLAPCEGAASVGRLTSGSPSPTLGTNIAMGYVPRRLSHPGTPLLAKLSPTASVQLRVAKLPFIETKYYTKTKTS